MSEVKNPKFLFKVEIIESEEGWGSKVDELKYFDNEKEAKEFVKNYNKENNKKTVPGWYMYASYYGKVH